MPPGKKAKKGGKSPKPANAPVKSVVVPPGLEAVQDQIRQIAENEEGGWGLIAEAIKTQPEIEPQVMFEFLARTFGKEALPLLAGAALDEDEEFALGALEALPLLATRAAGDALAAAYGANPEGERGRVARVGVQALQARGIKVSIPDSDAVAQRVPTYQIRDILESLPDAVGGRETLVRLQDRYGIWSTVAVIWNDRAGVKNGFLTPFSRTHWEEMVRTQREQGVDLITVPNDYARWQVRQARNLNEVSGFPLEDHVEGWDEVMGEPSEGYIPPDPTEGVRALPEEARNELAEGLALLMADGILSSWAFEPADVQPLLDQYQPLADEIYAIPEDEEPDQELFEKFQAVLAEAARSVLTPEMDAQIRERLRDAARKFEWQGNHDAAQILAATLVKLEETDDPAASPFYCELAANGFELLNEILQDGDDPEALRYDPMEVYTDEEEGA
ncbi:MAG: hypothetical protein ACO1SX_25865 [Actinomycetota bacterium]